MYLQNLMYERIELIGISVYNKEEEISLLIERNEPISFKVQFMNFPTHLLPNTHTERQPSILLILKFDLDAILHMSFEMFLVLY